MKASDLRNAVLRQAIQGKLVPQNPNDETVNALLNRIKEEKEQLFKNGNIRRDKPLPEITQDEKPFEIPDGWEWVRLGELSLKLGAGSTPTGGKAVYKTEGVKFIRSQNVYNDGLRLKDVAYIDEITNNKMKGSQIEPKDILLNITGGSIGRCCIVDDNFDIGNVNQHVSIIRLADKALNSYIHFCIISDYIQSLIMDVQVGVSREGLSMFKLSQFLIPIPPLEEQKRIVAKIKEIMPKIDEYEKLEQELSSLENSFPDKLRKSILQYAVQGKLVQQNPADEPARILVERFKAEMDQLVKEGKIKKEKALFEISDEEKPFEIPEGWEWVRLNEICSYIQRGKSPVYSTKMDIPVIAQKCIQWKSIEMEKCQFIDPDTINKYDPVRCLQDNDLLWNSTGLGTLGRINIFNSEITDYKIVVADSHVTVIRPFLPKITSKYLLHWFSGPLVQSEINEKSTGSTKQTELATSTIKNYIVPLPPLAEQQRIVDKVEVLMKLCDGLEENIVG